MVKGKPLLFARFWPAFPIFKNGSKRHKSTFEVPKNHSNSLTFDFEPFLKVEKLAKIDQNGKELAFIFSQFWPDFPRFKNGLKRHKNTLELPENHSDAVTFDFEPFLKS